MIGVDEVGLDGDLEALLAGRAASLAAPHELYAGVRARGRVYEHGPMLLVTHYDDVKQAVRDHGHFSNRALIEGSRIDAARARLVGEEREAFDEVTGFGVNFASRADGEDHRRLRRAAHRAFTPARIGTLETRARTILEELLAPLPSAETIDFMEVAFRFPLLIVAELLGVPVQDTDTIHEWSLALGAANASTDGAAMVAARGALEEFRAYVGRLTEGGSTDAGDLGSVLIAARDSDQLTHDELTGLFVQILFAGHETTTNLIASGILELLRRPEQWQALARDPSLVGGAVEELLRIVSPAQFISRVALEDVELAGVPVCPGQTVVPVLAAANRDPAVFEDPDALDICRGDASKHLAFGFGPHFCLGASLARLEARLMLETLPRRYPEASLAETDLEWTGGAMLRHLVRLPIVLGSAQLKPRPAQGDHE
jgi:cytochrome P450